MRFEIKINQPMTNSEPVLIVLLFTRKDEEYLNGCEEGIYNCASTVPEDRSKLLSVIEHSVNACLDEYEKELKKAIDNIIAKCEPQLKEFSKFIYNEQL